MIDVNKVITKRKLYRIIRKIRSKNLLSINSERTELERFGLLKLFLDSESWADAEWPESHQDDLYLDGRISHFKKEVKRQRLVIGI